MKKERMNITKDTIASRRATEIDEVAASESRFHIRLRSSLKDTSLPSDGQMSTTQGLVSPCPSVSKTRQEDNVKLMNKGCFPSTSEGNRQEINEQACYCPANSYAWKIEAIQD